MIDRRAISGMHCNIVGLDEPSPSVVSDGRRRQLGRKNRLPREMAMGEQEAASAGPGAVRVPQNAPSMMLGNHYATRGGRIPELCTANQPGPTGSHSGVPKPHGEPR